MRSRWSDQKRTLQQLSVRLARRKSEDFASLNLKDDKVQINDEIKQRLAKTLDKDNAEMELAEKERYLQEAKKGSGERGRRERRGGEERGRGISYQAKDPRLATLTISLYLLRKLIPQSR
ncbi:MAG: hypothetical protein ACLR6B_03470 [Blautia sp.]